MSKKRALIVDDSKSARVVLGRMLQKYDIEVETAESAEAALEYLKQHRPDVIFMDHLMPGMDGFQAVQAIKNNPDTATIPIMMYTSQQGELYVGQARALGAVGVLPKLVKPVDVSKVLYQLHLLHDRRDLTPPAFINANPAATPAPSSDRSGSGETLPTESQVIAGLVPADWHPQLESALRNHDAELRRFMVATLDTFSDRVAGRISEDVRTLVNETPALQSPPNLPDRITGMWIAAVLLALIPGIVFGVFYLRSLEYNHQLSANSARLEERNVQLSAQIQRMNEREAQAQLLAGAENTGEEMNGTAMPAGQAPVSAPLVEAVPYGEVPLAMTRVDTLRDLLDRMREQSFKGQVHIETFTGRFCLKGNSTDGYVLAPAASPAAECDLVGNPHEESLSPAQHESLAFANLRSSVRQKAGDGVSVEIALNGDRQAAPYPRTRNNMNAGQWNEIAARNNRVEFRAVPAP